VGVSIFHSNVAGVGSALPILLTARTLILTRAKFMVDMSSIAYLNDGGGTQYTFLEAIYSDCAIVLNRKWIDGIDKKYCDFREGVNCFAVSDGKELAELLDNDKIDTEKIVNNAKKLMYRHIQADWNKVTI
jgi:hypothetical protein